MDDIAEYDLKKAGQFIDHAKKEGQLTPTEEQHVDNMIRELAKALGAQQNGLEGEFGLGGGWGL